MTKTQSPHDPNKPRALAAAIERIKQLTTGSTRASGPDKTGS
jgi:hypothetical protein